MRILNVDEFKLEKQLIIDFIIRGAVFIHPTDTIYGIGCNAQNPNAVKKARKIKARALLQSKERNGLTNFQAHTL